ncbi:E3 ubiquitin-protein ligase TRIM71-like [Mytilus edulis]|uniref:E3 ubiquitin-protein ligase TRIM71-like n=1 Tax=Mytilus edulis TaxID=6550 RepID=UPI0039F083A3
MASSGGDNCTLCNDDDGTSTEAVTWCTECEVLLCAGCEKHHTKSKASKDHKTMSTKDYHNLPKFMLELSSQCRDHNKKFELYCSFHACPCCVQCITDKHKKCHDLKPLSDILKQVKSSASVQLFEKDLKNVKENLEEIIKYLNSRMNTSNSQKTKAAEQIRSMRKSIDDFLNKLEQEIFDDLESKHSQLKSKMNTLLQQLKTQADQISQLQSEFSKMTQYANELQMYVGLREIEKTTSQATKYIDELKSRDNFEEKNLEVNISPALQSILQEVKLFGNININTSQSTLRIKPGRKDQAQNLFQAVPRLEEIKPTMLRTLTIPEDMNSTRIPVCRILTDGKCLILNRYRDGRSHALLLFGNDGIFERQVITFTEYPHDACYVTNNTVAVALGINNKTVLVDLKKNQIIQTIQLSHYCFGVASDGKLLVISNDQKSTIVILDDMSQTILEGVGVNHISLFGGNIYATIFMENNVCCYKSTGEPLWTFQHHDIDGPEGIALDKHGFVYIASWGNNSIVVVSPDGKTCKTILSEADGINYPVHIDINRETGIMIVSSKEEKTSAEKDRGNHYHTAIIYKI